MDFASFLVVCKLAGYGVVAALSWYASHKAQIAALAKSAEALDLAELFDEIRAHSGK